ncbi:MFS general substrate transporter [Ganoderma sinense ZZ0214-1]|uniref:MFS general substrate transporter n=1 Tax=Ganoderma sinense ZZ0214-1 TaxID=1077348 RepID=A0A2G8S1C0_9APHY|nr:MFS general substrate transporter [Ganoderma sinense ZZ0214-1]
MDSELIKARDMEAYGQKYELHDLKHEVDASTTGHSSPTNGSHAQLQVLEHSEPQEGTTFQQLAPIDRGFGAWTFCASAFVAEMFIWGFLFRMLKNWSVIVMVSSKVRLRVYATASSDGPSDYYTTHSPFNSSSQVAVAAVGTVGLGIQYGEVLFLSIMFRRYPEYMKAAMWCALALYFTCLFCSSFATKVWQLILLQGVGLGFSGGIMYLPTMILLPQWFSERRGLAGGIIFAGTGVGEKVGLRWTLRIWAIMTCATTGIAFLGIRPRIPVVKRRPGQERPRFIVPQMQYFKSPLFLSFSLTCLVQGLSYFPVSLYIASFTQQLSTPLTATIVLSLFNSAGVVGQVILGYLTDRYAYPWVMFFSSLGSALAAFLLWGFAQGPALIYPFAIIFGALSGGFSAVWPNAAVDCAGRKPENADITYAGTAAFKGVSAVIGPILSGFLLEAGRSTPSLGGYYGRAGYGAVEIFVGSCALATGLGSIVVAAARQRVAS